MNSMTGSPNNLTERERLLHALKTIPENDYYIWDGQDEDDRPLSYEEMQNGIINKQVLNAEGKTHIDLQIDNAVLNYFRTAEIDLQTGINSILNEWLKNHSTV